MNTKGFAFPTPKDIKREPETVRIIDGREVINKMSKDGKKEYRRRVQVMLERQGGRCCLCGLPLRLELATFEHQDGRGMSGGRRDDRIEKDGKPYNGAACWECNSKKGSRRIKYVA